MDTPCLKVGHCPSYQQLWVSKLPTRRAYREKLCTKLIVSNLYYRSFQPIAQIMKYLFKTKVTHTLQKICRSLTFKWNNKIILNCNNTNYDALKNIVKYYQLNFLKEHVAMNRCTKTAKNRFLANTTIRIIRYVQLNSSVQVTSRYPTQYLGGNGSHHYE